MLFDAENPVVKSCAAGMDQEVVGNREEARILYQQAWDQAVNDADRFIAAHYLARVQETLSEKLHWDRLALQLALSLEGTAVLQSLPSLYLNVGKGLEDTGQSAKALEHYQLALTYATELSQEGYGKMIREGILAGIQRVS